MTTAVWPGVFEAMRTYGFAANPVQNSVRELSTLDDVLAGRPPERNYACGFGTIESGYTGSTYEGLWVAGVLAALQEGASLQYGADADHLQVKRGPNGRARALELVKASRYYTFFTLDMADMLHYGALNATEATSFLDDNVANVLERRAILAVHVAPLQAGDVTCCPTVELVSRFAAKYWDALDAFEDLVREISAHKDGQTFDLEFTVDEHPAEVNAFDCLTSPEELVFLLREIERRGLPVTHLAPNYGAEKGWDYRGTDGLEALGHRVAALQAIAGEFGVMLDFHSADDLSAPVRAVLRRATGGWLHLQDLPHAAAVICRGAPRPLPRAVPALVGRLPRVRGGEKPWRVLILLRTVSGPTRPAPTEPRLGTTRFSIITGSHTWAGVRRRAKCQTASSSTNCLMSSIVPTRGALSTTSAPWPWTCSKGKARAAVHR